MRIKYLLPLALLLIAGGLWLSKENKLEDNFPIPTNGETEIKDGGEEDGDNQINREAWFDLMHSTAPGTDWEAIEYQTSMRRHIQRSEARSNATSRGDNEILANGNLTGEWFERGSLDQAGSVFVTEYKPATDMIYLISAGGTLFKGPRSGNDWEVINEDLRFENDFLKFIDTDNGERLLANITDRPHYSDDGGYTWTPSTGIPFDDPNGRTMDPIVLEDGSNEVYLLSKKSYWENFGLFRSTDNGETYQQIAGLGNSDQNRFEMVQPHHSNDIYVLEKTENFSTTVFKLDTTFYTLEPIIQNNNFGFGTAPCNIAAIQMDTMTRFVSFNGNNEVYQSDDLGANWTLKGQMPSSPWGVGLYMSPSNPDLLMYGDIECYTSSDGGISWNKLNEWWEYYGDVDGSLHADMMYFNEFETTDGSSFFLVSNHGGLNIADSLFININNLGLTGLNVSQYYDVVTDPVTTVHIYAGSQDQGFQRALDATPEEPLNFDQVISGDYGHIVFSENGSRMWMVYPGGWVTYYDFPTSAGNAASYDLDSNDETVWIPPMMSSPIPEENAIYLAGGNANGGNGSYLIKLTYNPAINDIEASQIDYDFMDFSGGGTISMMRTSPVNPEHWFVSTTNGRFFYSYDSGATWDQSINFVAGGHYLYGASIYPSKLDENVVYFAGSGYSNPAVFKSVDGGQNFESMNIAMPSTLVFELAANEEETLFFAATEAGPYVYVVADEQWYDMAGMGAPNQTYWSVEYLDEIDRIRFGTYGRGIWDFQIVNEVSTSQPIVANEALSIFPNPSTDFISIGLDKTHSDKLTVDIRNINGQQILSKDYNLIKGQAFSDHISLKSYPKGIYVVTIRDGEYLSSSQVVLQ